MANQAVAFRKLVIIGDGACGKTSLLSVFTLGYFPPVCSHLYISPTTAANIANNIMCRNMLA